MDLMLNRMLFVVKTVSLWAVLNVAHFATSLVIFLQKLFFFSRSSNFFCMLCMALRWHMHSTKHTHTHQYVCTTHFASIHVLCKPFYHMHNMCTCMHAFTHSCIVACITLFSHFHILLCKIMCFLHESTHTNICVSFRTFV